MLAGKYFRFIFHLSNGLLIALTMYAFYGKNWHTRSHGKQIKKEWMNRLAVILGLKIRISGIPSHHPCLMVANHISWLDVICINALTPVIFVAKSSVKSWPLIGLLAEISGTLFINRENKQQLGSCHNKITDAIANGSTVMIFPEGTTTDGNSVNNFKSSLFQSSFDAKCETQPCVIQYHSLHEATTPAPFVGDDEFLPHLHRILKYGTLMVNVHFFESLPASSFDSRKELANFSRNQIQQKLGTTTTQVNSPERTQHSLVTHSCCNPGY